MCQWGVYPYRIQTPPEIGKMEQ